MPRNARRAAAMIWFTKMIILTFQSLLLNTEREWLRDLNYDWNLICFYYVIIGIETRIVFLSVSSQSKGKSHCNHTCFLSSHTIRQKRDYSQKKQGWVELYQAQVKLARCRHVKLTGPDIKVKACHCRVSWNNPLVNYDFSPPIILHYIPLRPILWFF